MAGSSRVPVLFEEPVSIEELQLAGGELTLIHNWLGEHQALDLFDRLRQSLQWEQSHIRLYGRGVSIPRLNAWYADAACEYRYSGYQMPRHDWSEELLMLREKLQLATGLSFNSVLANLYRDGNDSVGWHSDDEPELGHNPVIASISLGEVRRFCLRHKRNQEIADIELMPGSGSLLIMAGSTQHNWKHCLPKTRKSTSARINLTFRRVLCDAQRE